MAREALIDSPLAHGTAVLRRAAVERAGGWVERALPEDVDLWLRLLRSGARFAKLPHVLYGWRQHPGSATRSDPRYAPERHAALRLESLQLDFLRRRRAPTLVGVGRSLALWQRRLRHAGFTPGALEAARPTDRLPSLRLPLILVFGAMPARARWREHLVSAGLRERDDFVFVG